MILLFLLVLPLSAFDVLRDHLENLIDHSVNPCDDFYSHVCKSGTPGDRFIGSKLRSSFNNISTSFFMNPRANYEILSAIRMMNRGNSESIKNMNYDQLVRIRCGNDLECYRFDRLYYLKKFAFFKNSSIPYRDKNINSSDDLKTKIDKTILATSRLINDTLPLFFSMLNNGELRLLNIKPNHRLFPMRIYGLILSRIQMIEFLKTNSTFNDLHEIKEFTNKMKNSMLENIERTKWLHESEANRAVVEKILKRVSTINIYHDMDHIDRNLTTLRGLEREFDELYHNIEERRTGVEELDNCFRLLETYQKIWKNLTDEMKTYILRINRNFLANAFYNYDNSITIMAPYLFKKLVSSELVSEPLMTQKVVGHELFHSLFARSYSDLIELYGNRGVCLMDHYQKTCTLFGKGNCANSRDTIYEDGTDAEAVRLLYEMFEKDHSGQMDTKIEIQEVTLSQAFFYYTSLLPCRDSRNVHNITDPHSSGHVRVNALATLMPEFSRAFGCKNGDRMFTEEPRCRIFGEDS